MTNLRVENWSDLRIFYKIVAFMFQVSGIRVRRFYGWNGSWIGPPVALAVIAQHYRRWW